MCVNEYCLGGKYRKPGNQNLPTPHLSAAVLGTGDAAASKTGEKSCLYKGKFLVGGDRQ